MMDTIETVEEEKVEEQAEERTAETVLAEIEELSKKVIAEQDAEAAAEEKAIAAEERKALGIEDTEPEAEKPEAEAGKEKPAEAEPEAEPEAETPAKLRIKNKQLSERLASLEKKFEEGVTPQAPIETPAPTATPAPAAETQHTPEQIFTVLAKANNQEYEKGADNETFKVAALNAIEQLDASQLTDVLRQAARGSLGEYSEEIADNATRFLQLASSKVQAEATLKDEAMVEVRKQFPQFVTAGSDENTAIPSLNKMLFGEGDHPGILPSELAQSVQADPLIHVAVLDGLHRITRQNGSSSVVDYEAVVRERDELRKKLQLEDTPEAATVPSDTDETSRDETADDILRRMKDMPD